jgi:perosamine synthetase
MIEYASLQVEDRGEWADVAIHRVLAAEGQDRIIPVCEPVLDGNEKRYVVECIRTNWISSAGDFITRFEGAFKAFCGTRHAVTCTSGTAALQLVLYTLGIGEGDEVVIPTYVAPCASAASSIKGRRVMPRSRSTTGGPLRR